MRRHAGAEDGDFNIEGLKKKAFSEHKAYRQRADRLLADVADSNLAEGPGAVASQKRGINRA